MDFWFKIALTLLFLAMQAASHASLAGGRPNAFSEGQNAFAGIVNPANAVWIKDRLDIGGFWIYQKSSLKSDGNPFFPTGSIDTSYKVKNIFSGDMAMHKLLKVHICEQPYDLSLSLAIYTTPALAKVRTETPLPIVGTTPIQIKHKVDVISAVVSFKANEQHSIGISMDFLQFSHKRNGFQSSDNPFRSVSPGHVTNKGNDFSYGMGCTIGWRWNISKALCFGAAWTLKSHCGQYRKYRGYEPQHAKNYLPETFGAGFRYRFSSTIAGRLEVLWSGLGKLPGANDNFLSDGQLNTNRRGSTHSPGPGLQAATFINIGLGYKWNERLSIGTSFSHRFQRSRENPSFVSHTYRHGAIYEVLSIGANFNCQHHDLFFSFSYGFENRSSGSLPLAAGGGGLHSKRSLSSCSLSWGYLF